MSNGIVVVGQNDTPLRFSDLKGFLLKALSPPHDWPMTRTPPSGKTLHLFFVGQEAAYSIN